MSFPDTVGVKLQAGAEVTFNPLNAGAASAKWQANTPSFVKVYDSVLVSAQWQAPAPTFTASTAVTVGVNSVSLFTLKPWFTPTYLSSWVGFTLPPTQLAAQLPVSVPNGFVGMTLFKPTFMPFGPVVPSPKWAAITPGFSTQNLFPLATFVKSQAVTPVFSMNQYAPLANMAKLAAVTPTFTTG